MTRGKFPGQKVPVGLYRDDRQTDRASLRSGSQPLPTSRGKDAGTLDRSGIRDRGYLDKKNTPSGLDAQLNKLPPGMEISDQEVSAASGQKIPFKRWSGIGRDGRLNDESAWKTEDEV